MTAAMMTPDTSQIEPIRYAPLPFTATAYWRKQDSFAFVGCLPQLTLSDSELLQSSHHLPIAIDLIGHQPQVVAVTAAQFQRTPLVDAEGRWRRGYAPIALRCLPLRLAEGTTDALEVAVNLDGRGTTDMPVVGDDGAPTAEIRQVIGLLRRLEVGKRRLQAAAEKLLIADVLAPFQMMRAPGGASVQSRMLTVDRNKFAALSKRRALHIAREDFLAIDLAAACLFSQRLLPGPVSVAVETRPDDEGPFALPSTQLALKTTTQLDDSELFSFEAFNKTGSVDDKNN
jgi:hypothetical protein